MVLHHLPDELLSRFLLELAPPGGAPREIVVPSPHLFPVPGRPDSFLMNELLWYLESFPDYPFPPETEHAEQVLAALHSWGEAAFASLFGDDQGKRLASDAAREGWATFRLRIESDDPLVLSWPWEALGDPQSGPLGAVAWIERTFTALASPSQSPPMPPLNPLNVLLVTARPGDNDVAYRSVSRPIVDLASELPLRVHVLRPPTLPALARHLLERPQTYHVLHFDGHGDTALRSRSRMEGRLFFEDDEGNDYPVFGSELAGILRQSPVPLIVLNACRSATYDTRMRDPFASTAGSLLQAGMGAVVAMAYPLNVEGARRVLPGFYRNLCATGDVGTALREGRLRMREQTERIGPRGRFSLQDWLVPVLYRRADSDLGFQVTGGEPGARRSQMPSNRGVGRDGAVLQAERFLRRPAAALVVHGLAGVGKTSFVRDLAEWLTATEGVEEVFWIDQRGAWDVQQIQDRLLELALDSIVTVPDSEKPQAKGLIDIFRGRRCLVVLDGLELADQENRLLLLDLLRALRGGSTKAVITSRSDLPWLLDERLVLSLGGLRGEERWQLVERIVRERAPAIDWNQPRLEPLIEWFAGHPQTMWSLIPKLDWHGAQEFFEDFRSGAVFSAGLRDCEALLAPMRFLSGEADEPLASLRFALAFHERFLNADLLGEMTHAFGVSRLPAEIQAVLLSLVDAGLLRKQGESFEIHPALPGFLRAHVLPRVPSQEQDGWARAFASVMGGFAYELASRPFHRQDRASEQYQANFLSALEQAQRLGALEDEMAILQWMATFAHQRHLYDSAIAHFERLLELHRSAGERANVAAIFQRLGIVAQDRGDLKLAETWYRNSLQLDEELGAEVAVACSCHQLGMLVQERQDFIGAGSYFRRALEIFERQRLSSKAAASCHQLGILAQEKGDLEEAAQWYERGRLLVGSVDDEHILARFEHQLAVVALLLGELPKARLWCRRSLARKLRLRDEAGIASGYHQLGLIAQEEGDLAAAERYFHRSLRTSEKLGRRVVMSSTYHHLGVNSQLKGEVGAARRWLLRSLDLAQGPDDVELANTHHSLGMVAHELGELEEAEREYATALRLIERKGNEREKIPTLFNLGQVLADRGRPDESGRQFAESLQRAVQVGDQVGAAKAWHSLGRLAEARHDHAAAERSYRESLKLSEQLDLESFSAASLTRLAAVALDRGDDEEGFNLLLEALSRLRRGGDADGIQAPKEWLASVYSKVEKEEDRERFRLLAENAGLGDWLARAEKPEAIF